jgi:uncharacterized iron-regulated protein
MAIHIRRHLGFRLTAAGALALALAGCGPVFPAADGVPGTGGATWESPLLRDHPLAGRVWSVGEGRFVTPADAAAALGGARYALLGEKHDNIDHKRIQYWLTHRLAAGRRPAIALEAIDAAQEKKIAAYLQRNPKSAAGIGDAAGWTRGWLPWKYYEPAVQAVLDTGGPVLAASPDRALLRQVFRKGVDGIPALQRMSLGLDTDLPPAFRDVLFEEIKTGHCNQLPENMNRAMVTVQRVKDAVMAAALIEGAYRPDRDMAVLIAGNGHVRRDLAVPWHLRNLTRGVGRIVAVGLLEVARDVTDPRVYAGNFGVAALPYDFVWFTPRVDEDDPCAKNAEQFRRSRERNRQQNQQRP